MKYLGIPLTTLSLCFILNQSINLSGLAASSSEINNLVLEGTHLIETGNQEQAVLIFTRAIKADPSRTDALLGRARAYQESHQLSRAAVDAEAAYKLHPDDVWATYRVASIKGSLGDSATAINLLTRLVEAQPSNLSFRLERSDQFFRIRKYSAALSDADFVIKKAPSESLAHFRAGCSYRASEKFAQAQSELELATRLDPRDYYIRELGDLLVQMHQYNRAVLVYKKGAQMQPQDGSWQAKLGVVALLLHQPLKSALTYYDRAVDLSPTNASILAQRAAILFQINRKEEAILAVTKAISMDSRDPLSYFRRACFYNSMSNYPKALSDLNSAIKLQPRYYFYSGRAGVYMRMAEFEKAIADADAALILEPRDVGSLKVHSFLYALGGNFEQALDDEIEAMHSLHTQTSAPHRNPSSGSLPAPLIGQVANSYSEMLRLFPDDDTALYNRGFAYLCLGKSAAGASDLQRFAQKSKSINLKVLAAAFASLGYREAGENVRASSILDEAIAFSKYRGSDLFPQTLLSYLKGRIKAEAVFVSLPGKDAIAQAQCVIGIDLILKKQTHEGVVYLNKVLRDGDDRLDEFSLAQTRLSKLKL